jgi:hypothetical protein
MPSRLKIHHLSMLCPPVVFRRQDREKNIPIFEMFLSTSKD